MNSTTDRKAIRAAEKASAETDRRMANVITTLASSSAGREWLWRELETAHIFHALPLERDIMNRAEGERNAGLRLLGQIMTHCPEEFLTMMREANGRRTDAALNAATAERSRSEEPGREFEEPSGSTDE